MLRRAMMAGGESDPFWPYVGSLLHFNGADESTAIVDETGRPWSVTGNAQIDTGFSKFGGASLLLDGSGSYISSTSQPLGSGDWTVECWVRKTASRIMVLYDNWGNGIANSWGVAINAAGQPYLFSSDGGPSVVLLLASGTPIANNAWTHVEFSRVASIIRVFVNGASSGSVVSARDFSGVAASLSIGAQVNTRNATYDFAGHIDESRITIGVGRHVTSFTPKNSEFPSHSGPTVLSPAAVTTDD